MKKPAFPKTPEGVTDWDKVFEDPDQGLIPAIRKTNSNQQLRSCLTVIVRQLFTRKGDELRVAQLTRQIDDLFQQSPGQMPTDAAIGILRLIKIERQEKARAYLAKKKNNKQKGRTDRRGKTAAGGSANVVYLFFKNPRYLVGLCLVLLVLLGGVITGLVLETLSPTVHMAGETDDASAAASKDALSGTAATSKPAREKRPEDFALEDFTSEPGVAQTAAILRLVPLPRAFGERQRGATHVLPFIVIKDRGDLKSVCLQLPYIRAQLNVELSAALKRYGGFDAAALARVGAALKRQINDRLEDAPVRRVHLAFPKSHRDSSTRKCTLAPSTLMRYLS